MLAFAYTRKHQFNNTFRYTGAADMAKQFDSIDDKIANFIAQQKLFFVATAGAEGRVNLSPKGMDSLRVVSPNQVVWLNLTGSGNETAAHLFENDRITLMFCAFEGAPNILRLFGRGKVIHPRDADWGENIARFPLLPGARQIIDVEVELVQTSCGFAVPLFDYQGDRETLTKWSENKGEQGIQQYWEDQNRFSLDGKPTHILD